MTSFEVRLKPSVEKDLRNLPKTIVRRVVEKIEALADDPLPHHSRKLHGTEHLYRIRVGQYRVVYQVNIARKVVTIHHVRHRSEVYKGL